MNTIESIYIPRMKNSHSYKNVENIIASANIGTVTRIDFIPLNKKPGFREIMDNKYKSAFIYIIKKEEGNNSFWSKLNDKNNDACIIIRTSNGIKTGEYWICLKNKNPIQETMMNVHQIVDNGRRLEEIVEKQALEIEELKKQNKIIVQAIYQLHGGLYNQTTQAGSLETVNNILFDIKDDEISQEPDKSKWTIWPTTRQGDNNEKRIEKLEEIIMGNKHCRKPKRRPLRVQG